MRYEFCDIHDEIDLCASIKEAKVDNFEIEVASNGFEIRMRCPCGGSVSYMAKDKVYLGDLMSLAKWHLESPRHE